MSDTILLKQLEKVQAESLELEAQLGEMTFASSLSIVPMKLDRSFASTKSLGSQSLMFEVMHTVVRDIYLSIVPMKF